MHNRKIKVAAARRDSTAGPLSFLLLAATLLLLGACNTMEGAGQDIQQTGEALEHSADRNKAY